ncbi:MAG: hypothetical protein KJ941_01855 [Bacteroidetes bacterium]|nr:hypothetical protein [Bacteroidota bacterium]
MKRFIIFVLLFSFALVSMPKNWMHKHELAVKSEHNESKDITANFDAQDCSYCYFDLSNASLPVYFNGFKLYSEVEKLYSFQINESQSLEILSTDSRGPPRSYWV